MEFNPDKYLEGGDVFDADAYLASDPSQNEGILDTAIGAADLVGAGATGLIKAGISPAPAPTTVYCSSVILTHMLLYSYSVVKEYFVFLAGS